MYNHTIEVWWRHLGCYDREMVSTIPYSSDDTADAGEYLERTDDWWNNLTDSEKKEIYDNCSDEF